MSKIQQHLQATIGKSQPKNYEMEEGLHSSDGKNKKDSASIEYEPEPSARIEHNNIDGSLQLNIDQEQIIAHQLSQGYAPRPPAKKQYQVNNSNIIHEEGEQIEESSLDLQKHNRSEVHKPGAVLEQPAILDDSVKEVADVIIEIDDGLPEEDDEDDDDDVMLFIEYKYCTICHIEQPLRCKHCKTCDHCVATHDHHCPWIGNCVGERNRFYFFWFLQCQFLQLVTGLIMCIRVVLWKREDDERLQNDEKVLILLAFFVCACFTVFVLPLVFFHIYLACVNLTSWEFLSWMRITYLKIWPKRYGSPFSQGVRHNLRMYCCYNFRRKKVCHQWRMPKTLPKLKV